jgi:pimeloyl-ACP methyl ester carboxylesterase
VSAIRTQLGLQELHLVGHSWGAAVALEYLLTGDRTGVRSVTFVGPLLSTPRWIEDANSLVAMLPPDAQDAITTALNTGKFDSLEFQALVPGSVVKVIPNAAHAVNIDQSQAFNAALVEFLSAAETR